jgi:hypothetical protein
VEEKHPGFGVLMDAFAHKNTPGSGKLGRTDGGRQQDNWFSKGLIGRKCRNNLYFSFSLIESQHALSDFHI